ncbi:MAG: CoA-binding protein, partial [Thermodesulfobacteriota bacterium]|nr:CoA-binding protein [Thermodesulfobacteriota bacterium]
MEHYSESKVLLDRVINNGNALDVVFHPRSVAVVGALDGPVPFGYYFSRCLMDFGFNGPIYPVNPSRENVLGLKAYPDMSHIPDPVDYVICCIPAPKIPSLLHDCHAREVKCVHIFSGRLSETGRKEAEDLETEILRQAKMLNIRLIGPNCMGIYYPREGLSFNYDLPKEEGAVGGLFQSGGLSIQFTRYGGLQGLRFSKVISYGNGIDLDECEFLTYFAHDDETKIIVLYIEGVKDGKRFMNTLRDVTRIKPVLVMKGGRGIAGLKAAASHTASLGGSDVIWKGLFKQLGVTLAGDLNELVDLSVIFSSLPTVKGRRAAILGGGGGQSVVSADIFEEAGLEVPPLPSDMRENLRERSPEIGDWIGNPIDFSAFAP